MLIPLLVIIGTVIVSAFGSWLATYSVQREKIHRVKKHSALMIKMEREHSALRIQMEQENYFNQGFTVGVAHEKKDHAKALEEQYLNGYNDGLANEWYIERSSSTGKHHYIPSNDTPATYREMTKPLQEIFAGVEGLETLIDDELTAVYQTIHPTA